MALGSAWETFFSGFRDYRWAWDSDWIGLDWIYVGNTPLPAPQTSRFAWFWYAIGTIRQVLMWIMFFFFRSPLFCFCAFFFFFNYLSTLYIL
jgi:hypothetical protein